jgi:hypothetical protein
MAAFILIQTEVTCDRSELFGDRGAVPVPPVK